MTKFKLPELENVLKIRVRQNRALRLKIRIILSKPKKLDPDYEAQNAAF